MGAEPVGAPRQSGEAFAGQDSGPTMDAAMGAFRDRARVTNLARVQVITEALQGMGEGVLDEQVRVTARAAAHSLAGSAGTFGFAQASQLGRSLEDLLEKPEGAGATEDLRGRAQRGLEQVAWLRQALADPALSPTTTRAGSEGDAQ